MVVYDSVCWEWYFKEQSKIKPKSPEPTLDIILLNICTFQTARHQRSCRKQNPPYALLKALGWVELTALLTFSILLPKHTLGEALSRYLLRSYKQRKMETY